MNLNVFAKKVAKKEKGKKQVSIGQIKEILRIANKLTKGLVYKVVRSI